MRSVRLFLGVVFIGGLLLSSPAAQERGLRVVAAEALGPEAVIGKQWAIFIAIDRYQEWRPLANPVKDAKEIRDILREGYFIDEVRELYDREATAAEIRRLFVNLQREIRPNDSVFVFYAGHGLTDSLTNTGFWISADAGKDPFEQHNWLPNIQVRSLLSALPAKHVFLISDACFSGDILDLNRGPEPEIGSAYFRRAYSRVSRQVITSGAAESVPDSSEFALRLKSALRRAELSCIDPEYLFTIVREVRSTQPMLGVIRSSEHQEGGSFLFFRRPAVTAVQPRQSQTTPQQQQPAQRPAQTAPQQTARPAAPQQARQPTQTTRPAAQTQRPAPAQPELPHFVLNPPVAEDSIFGIGAAKLSSVIMSFQMAEQRARVSLSRQIAIRVQNMIADRIAGSGVSSRVLGEFQESVEHSLAGANFPCEIIRREVAKDGTSYILVSISTSVAKQYVVDRILGVNSNRALAQRAVSFIDEAFANYNTPPVLVTE
jgi:hypothetical protein